MRVLAALLRVNTSLRALDISSNSLGAEAGVVMRDALEENKAIQVLDCRVNKIAPEVATSIRDIVRRNEAPAAAARSAAKTSIKTATRPER